MWDENKVRIIDIAEDLGLSTATVSNVLHGKTKKISDATVKKVERKLEESGYIPNMAATLLARNDSRIVGVVVNNHRKYEGRVFEDPFISAAINYLSDEIENSGYFMMLKKVKEIMDIVRFASMWNLDGLIIIGFCEDEYQNLRDHIRIPFVVYDGFMKEQGRISNVTIDDFDGGRQVGEYLKKMGHRKVLCISDNDICMDLDRHNGLNSGLGRDADFLMIPMSKEKRDIFYQENLNKIKTYSAIFAVSDYYAIDIMVFLKNHGISVPEDISIVGFDGIADCQRVVPLLTSVYQNNELRAKVTMELLIKMLKDNSFSQSVCIPVKLIQRESVRKI
ncbi:MAG: LacI family transcriptional regulator [Treponema sp.]|nr:LacI family transcriptional regulator [Treponema sp.]